MMKLFLLFSSVSCMQFNSRLFHPLPERVHFESLYFMVKLEMSDYMLETRALICGEYEDIYIKKFKQNI